jgi:hypothetical protein
MPQANPRSFDYASGSTSSQARRALGEKNRPLGQVHAPQAAGLAPPARPSGYDLSIVSVARTIG